MPHYLDLNNGLHFLDDAANAGLLPAGAVPISDEGADVIRSAGGSLTIEEQLAQYERDLDDFLDAKAQELTFKDRHSLALRAAYPNPWQALGQAFGEWMDSCNALAWQGKQDILAGIKPMPESKEQFLAELPAFVAPQ